jgi:hypothetical protein
MHRHLCWIAAALLSGCAGGERLRDVAPVVFRDVLGDDAEARFTSVGGIYVPVALDPEDRTLVVHGASGTMTAAPRTVEAGSEPASIEVGLDLQIRQLTFGERPPITTLALPRRIVVAVSSVRAIPAELLQDDSPVTQAAMVVWPLTAEAEALAKPPLRSERVAAGTFTLSGNGIEWSIQPRLVVPLEAASWDPRTGEARFIVSWMIEYATGEYGFGAIASTALQAKGP